MSLDETHDPALRSWVESANTGNADFPIQNLAYGVFRASGSSEPLRCGVAIGDQILDLTALHHSRILRAAAADALETCVGPALNRFMGAGRDAWSELRLALSRLLRTGAQPGSKRSLLVPQSSVEYGLPAAIGDYTDFYTSIHHATAVGRMFRPDNPLLPNYKWVPIAYHGRASSIRVSGESFRRPLGQVLAPGAATPELKRSARLDFELEAGVFIGPGNAPGTQIPIGRAEDHVFGLCLLNDWSARDVQAWEYQPLGPFLAKNFATTISPWIVTMAALAPFRTPWTRLGEDPQPLPYLDSALNRQQGGCDVQLEAWLETARMREARMPAHVLARSSFRHAYWSIAQMVTHHAVNGCNLQPGDLLGTGTQSGPDAAEAGSLLELTKNGQQPIDLPSGESRRFLEDGDAVILRGWCGKQDFARIGFGAASAQVVP